MTMKSIVTGGHHIGDGSPRKAENISVLGRILDFELMILSRFSEVLKRRGCEARTDHIGQAIHVISTFSR
jgi:hypothetical protein